MANHFRSETQLLASYNAYQERYANTIRESDKVLLRLIALRPEAKTLLDIGCSTGNFLAHVRGAFPTLKLVGGDIAGSSIAKCRQDKRLTGVDIRHMDITQIEGRFDIIISNAVKGTEASDVVQCIYRRCIHSSPPSALAALIQCRAAPVSLFHRITNSAA